jgi:hypothetical protein
MTTITTAEEALMHEAIATTTAARTAAVSQRALAAVFLLVGAFLVYLALFDQTVLASGHDHPNGATGDVHRSYLHEYFHDGRHLTGVPCD